MPFPTPGFVVKSTFLEYEPDADDTSQSPIRVGLRRSLSETDLAGARPLEQFGSGAYCRQLASETITGNPRAAPAAEGMGMQPDGRTTLLIENLPDTFSGLCLAELLDAEGFACEYTFVYVPMDLRTRTCNGYALVSFCDNERASKAYMVLNFFRLCSAGEISSDDASKTEIGRTDILAASWHDYSQGLDALIERYRNSPVMHHAVPDVYKPALFEKGKPVPFPLATRTLRMPRLRRKLTREQKAPDSGAGDTSSTDTSSTAKAADDIWFIDLVATRAPETVSPFAFGVSFGDSIRMKVDRGCYNETPLTTS